MRNSNSWLSRHPVLIAVLLALGLTLGTGTAVIVVQNTYDLDVAQVTIPVPDGTLAGVLARPQGTDEPVGVVVFVHGDGPTDATSSGWYRPIWESIARAGYASLSWSKPGVGESSGDWLDQSMRDRADEVETALDWVRDQPGIDPDQVGLWGASQGGWVVPTVAAEREDVAFTVLVSPAINWLRQGRYNLLAELEHDGATTDEREEAIAVSDETRRLLDEGATYERYRAETLDPEPMEADRWAFVLRNYRADATESLTAMAERGIPTLLLLGDDDLNVDTAETEAAYRAALDDSVEVRRFPGARHTLARDTVEDSAVRGLLIGTFTPRQVFAPGYLAAYQELLGRL